MKRKFAYISDKLKCLQCSKKIYPKHLKDLRSYSMQGILSTLLVEHDGEGKNLIIKIALFNLTIQRKFSDKLDEQFDYCIELTIPKI